MGQPDRSGRRSEDRDAHLTSRMDRFEAELTQLSRDVSSMGGKMQLVEAEQRHIKELFDARFQVISAEQNIHKEKLDLIISQLQTVLSAPSNSPAGQALLTSITNLDKDFRDHCQQVAELDRWKNKVDGALLLLRIAGVAGVVAFITMLIKAIQSLS